jgi:hypothetical protein
MDVSSALRDDLLAYMLCASPDRARLIAELRPHGTPASRTYSWTWKADDDEGSRRPAPCDDSVLRELSKEGPSRQSDNDDAIGGHTAVFPVEHGARNLSKGWSRPGPKLRAGVALGDTHLIAPALRSGTGPDGPAKVISAREWGGLKPSFDFSAFSAGRQSGVG